jgi:hypothetical protein
MIKRTSLTFASLFLVATLAVAKDHPLPLSEDAGASLSGKTVTVTRHEKPSLVAMTPGKAMFALVGAAAMVAAGNAIVKDSDGAIPPTSSSASSPAQSSSNMGCNCPRARRP